MLERSILGWILIGLVAGIVGKFFLPDRDPSSFTVTILIGIAGALLAGFVAQVAGIGLDDGLSHYAAAAGGAILLLAAYRLVISRRIP